MKKQKDFGTCQRCAKPNTCEPYSLERVKGEPSVCQTCFDAQEELLHKWYVAGKKIPDPPKPPDPFENEGWAELRLQCYRELGYALFYMKFLHPDWRQSEPGEKQWQRVKILCRGVAVDSARTEKYIWEGWRQQIENEIENMC